MQEIGSDAAVATGQSRRRGRPLARVQLQPEQSAELQRRVRAATSTQREALRARIILACAEGLNTPEAARICGTHVRTVERWRSRFLRLGLKGLKDRPRPGHKPKFGPVVRLQLIALACEPMESENGVSRRTIEQLRQVSISQGIVEGISWSSVQRILAQAELRPHLVRGWMHSPDPEFREKVTEITELYLNPPPGEVVLCVDEKTGMQALERRFADRPPAPRRARRREFEYKRHGTQSLFCAKGARPRPLSMFTRDESWRVATIGEGRKTSSALWKKSLPTTPKAKCTSSGIISISTTTDPWLAGAISIVATAIASSSTTLQNTPHGSTRWSCFSAFYKGNACETPASAQ